LSGSREQNLIDLLEELKAATPGIQSVVLVSSDAMPLASVSSDSSEEVVSAMASALLQTSERVADDLVRGRVEQVYLRCEEGDLVVVKVNDNAHLACMVDRKAKLGITFLEVSRCARKLADVI